MNLWHKTASETETLAQENVQPWYRQHENARESQTSPVLAPTPVTVTPTHFAPDAAERILARAGLLQETHRQNLSKEQVEAIAAEVGIEAEFVRLAMEQEAAGVLPQQASVYQKAMPEVRVVMAVAAAMAVYPAVGIPLLTMARHNPHDATFFHIVLGYAPALLALQSGLFAGRRRLGLYWGAGFGILTVATGLISWIFSGDAVNISTSDFPMFAVMIGVGALLGLVGAETRRQVSRRRVRNRGRRTVRRTETS